jgi:hypothetical protein
MTRIIHYNMSKILHQSLRSLFYEKYWLISLIKFNKQMYYVALNQVLSYKSTKNLRITNFCSPSEIKYKLYYQRWKTIIILWIVVLCYQHSWAKQSKKLL